MEPTDLTIEILKGIQSTLVDMKTELHEHGRLLRQHGERFERLEHRMERVEANTSMTAEILQVMSERMAFFERVATTAMEARSRMEDRVDDLERRVEALEENRPSQ